MMINYYLITKPGIVLGNLLTVLAGFFLASRGNLHYPLLFATLMGIACIMASGCVFNNVIDRNIDKKMERTKTRALVKELISGPKALLFGALLGLAGNGILLFYTNPLTTLIADIGFFTYVVLYSFWKCHTIYGTAIGSIAGAVPPIVGYCAVSNHLGLEALILFAMLVLWQMPHFFSIALLHFNDYMKAELPLLPIKRGIPTTKMRIFIYIVGFIGAAGMLTFFRYTGYAYLTVTSIFGLLWLLLSLKGFATDQNQVWAKHMFRFSLVTITMTCFMILLDTI